MAFMMVKMMIHEDSMANDGEDDDFYGIHDG